MSVKEVEREYRYKYNQQNTTPKMHVSMKCVFGFTFKESQNSKVILKT